MICKTCGNELRETDAVCDICGAEVPHDDAADVGVMDSAGDDTDEVSDEKMWPWDSSRTQPVTAGDSPAPDKPAEAPAQTEPLPPEPEVSGAAETPAIDNDAMFKTAQPPSGNKEHFDFKWVSEDFHHESKATTKDIKFEWGDLFGEKKPEPEEPESPEPSEPTAIENIVIDDPAGDEKFSGSIFGEDFFTRQSNVRENYDFYNDALREKQDAAESDTSFEDAIKAESDFADVQEPTIRVSLGNELSLHERSSDASSGDTPPREAPFHYDPAPFEPGAFHADPYDETPATEEPEPAAVTPAPFEPGAFHADPYDEMPAPEEPEPAAVTPAPFEPGAFHADPYDEISAAEEPEPAAVTPAPFEPGAFPADPYDETPAPEEPESAAVTPAPFEPEAFPADPYDEISTAEKSETDIFTSAPFDSEPLHADAGHTGFDVQEVADIPADVADIQETPDASSDSRYTALETAIDPVMQIHENPPRTRAEDIPSKPFTSADIARLDIFDTDVASPFAREPEGADVVSPFDLSDASVASLFGSSAPDWDAAQTSFATSVAQPESEPVPDAEPAAEEPSPDEAPHYHKMDAEAELKQNQKIQEIISQPVIFPFDEETGYVEPEAEGAGDDDPEDESVDSGGEAIREPVTEYSDDQSEPAVDETARKTAAEDGDDQGEYYSDKKADRKAAKEEKKKKKGQHRAGKDDAPDEAGNAQKPPARWLVIMMDILVVIAALVIAAFAFLKLAPDSGVAHILDQGVTKVAELFSGSGSDSADGGSSNDNEESIAPMPNKDALVSAQAGFNNRNIIEVVYDQNAGYNSNRAYSIQGVSGAKPIENDYWTTDDKGYVLYDEAAVAAVIRFNSELVSYVNGQQSDILSLLETGSKEEAVLNNYAASLTALEFRKLGIGEILTDGTYFYVFTNETAMETRNGIATELNSSKVYKLAADPVVSEMKIVEIETVA